MSNIHAEKIKTDKHIRGRSHYLLPSARVIERCLWNFWRPWSTATAAITYTVSRKHAVTGATFDTIQ